MINGIETLAGLVAAITTIIIFIKKPWQWYKNKVEEEKQRIEEEKQFKIKVIESFDKIEHEIQEVRKDTKENKMYILKDIIINDKLSLEERVKAGDEYVANGGNGFVKEVYHKLLDKVASKYEN